MASAVLMRAELALIRTADATTYVVCKLLCRKNMQIISELILIWCFVNMHKLYDSDHKKLLYKA